MIVTLICLAVLIGGIVWMCLTEDNGAAVAIVIIMAIICVCFILPLLLCGSVTEIRIAKWMEERGNIILGLEHNTPDSISKAELFNAKLELNRQKDSNPWINWFIPSFHRFIEPINIPKTGTIPKMVVGVIPTIFILLFKRYIIYDCPGSIIYKNFY